ncbi:MAG TPA: hypothetical protein VIX59_19760 [Candidatus Binataceae bacterium]
MESERRIFAARMVEARSKRGIGFTETRRSVLGKVHLAFSQLWGLFEENGEPPVRMMSGFSMHDLASFPQTYPKPDMSYLPARSVLECGELWSFSKGAGLLARRGASIIAGLMQIRAILVYPVSKPWDGTISYAATNFIKACDEVDWPYGQTLDGGKIWVQPMLLEGDNLQKLIHRVFEMGFETSGRGTIIRFENPLAIQPSLDRPAIPVEPSTESPPPGPESRGEEANGTAQS